MSDKECDARRAHHLQLVSGQEARRPEKPKASLGRMLLLRWLAGFDVTLSHAAFACGCSESELSMLRSGKRRIPTARVARGVERYTGIHPSAWHEDLPSGAFSYLCLRPIDPPAYYVGIDIGWVADVDDRGVRR
jgi:plasmid maintenance system antidote protein VapI